MRAMAVMLAALVLAPALAGASTPLRLVSGLHGVVTRGPTKPVCTEGEPCEAPAVGVVLEFRRNGVLAARVKTRPGGAYTVRLRPGAYLVVPVPRPRVGAGLTPRAVRVPKGRLARVDFHLDTGIQ